MLPVTAKRGKMADVFFCPPRIMRATRFMRLNRYQDDLIVKSDDLKNLRDKMTHKFDELYVSHV